jgi:hypothetical protein
MLFNERNTMSDLQNRIRAQLCTLPAIDIHTHLGTRGPRQAQSLADIVSYHWLHSELERAGAAVKPNAAHENPEAYMEAVIPFFPSIRNTSNHFVFMSILRDLYGYDGRTLTPQAWRGVDARIRQSAAKTTWLAEVCDKGNIKKVAVKFSDGIPEGSNHFYPYEYGEHLLSPAVTGKLNEVREQTGMRIHSLDELEEAIRKQVQTLKATASIHALHIWIGDSWSFQECGRSQARALFHQAHLGPISTDEINCLSSYTAGVLAEEAGKLGIVLQIFHGMNCYPSAGRFGGWGSHWNPAFLRSLPLFASRCPEAKIDIFLGTAIPSHEAAAISRICNNVSISGGWWHGFTPATLVRFFKDRLEMLPHTAWNAYFSDGYLIEWVYGKLALTRTCLARALAEEIDDGFLTEDDAIEIAKNALYDNPVRLYGLSKG